MFGVSQQDVRIKYAGKMLLDGPLSGFDICNNCTCHLLLKLRGGGKRAKASEEEIPFMFEMPKQVQGDIAQVTKALSLQTVDVPGWVLSVGAQSLKELKELESIAENMREGGKLDQHVNKFAQFVSEYKDLQVFFL